MNKVFLKTVAAVLLAAMCLSAQSCETAKTDDMQYMTVFYDNSTLSENGSIFETVGGGWSIEIPEKYTDDTALPKRTDMIKGEETVVYYKASTKVFGHKRDEYETEDGNYWISYEHETGKVLSIVDRALHSEPVEGQWLPEEEYKRIAVEYAISHSPILKREEYDVFVSIVGNYVSAGIQLKYENCYIDEYISMSLNQKGDVYLWSEKLWYPEGLPQNIRDAINSIDVEACKASVEHYVEECLKKNKGRKTELVSISDGIHSFSFYGDGKLAARVETVVSVNGVEKTEYFFVAVPA